MSPWNFPWGTKAEDPQKSYSLLRQAMVKNQLQRRGISDNRVITAMLEIPREQFVPAGQRKRAYSDCALPIELGQTISQPFTVAFMCQALHLMGPEKVLEIGTGSGYGAAVLSKLAREVHSIEFHSDLAASAADRLRENGITNVVVHQGDGSLGLPSEAPFDAIVATAAAPNLPKPYVEQLKDGGRIVIPIGYGRADQCLYLYRLDGDQLHATSLGGFVFVPMRGQHGNRR